MEAIDSYGHKYGVNSPQLNQLLLDVDKMLQDFRQNLTSNGLNDDVNIIVFSDHGMTNLTQIVNITDVLNMSDIKVIFQEPPYVTIWPEEGQLEKVGISINKTALIISKTCLFLDLSINEILKFSTFVYVNLIVSAISIHLPVLPKDFPRLFWDVFHLRI